MAKQDRYVRITLRIPAELHSRLVKAVADQPHSMNAEIVQCIERGLAHRDPPKDSGDGARAMIAMLKHFRAERGSIASSAMISALASIVTEIIDEKKEQIKADALQELQLRQKNSQIVRD